MALPHGLRNWVRVSRIQAYVGDILRFNAFILLLPLVVAFYYHEPIKLFIVASLSSYAIGWLFSSKKKEALGLAEAMLLTITVLMLVSLFSSIIFLGVFTDPLPERLVNSFFESVSGYTTTGLSVIDAANIESFPKSVLFLRALSQWVGGVGIIVMFILTSSYRDFNMPLIYKSERGEQKIHPTSYSNARELLKIYCFYTLVGFMLLNLFGMGWYSSIYNAMCSISTGGFWHNNSRVFNNVYSEMVTIGLMLLGSMGFFLHYTLLNGQLGKVLRNIELKALITIISWGTLLLLSTDLILGIESFNSFEEALFNVVSAATTTGYSTIDFSKISEFGKLGTVILMIIGAGVNSTGGGIKLMRFIIIIYSIIWFLKKIILPKNAVVPFKIKDVVVEGYETERAFLHATTHVIILVAGALLMTAYSYDTADSLFVSASAIGTVGLSTLPLHPAEIPVKLFLIIEMLVGRVETIPVLILMTYLLNYAEKKIKGADKRHNEPA